MMQTTDKKFCQKPAPDTIVAQFKRDYDKVKSYNEETRQNYINPFFNALAWDIYDEKGLQDVVPEDKIKIESKTKASDIAKRVSTLAEVNQSNKFANGVRKRKIVKKN